MDYNDDYDYYSEYPCGCATKSYEYLCEERMESRVRSPSKDRELSQAAKSLKEYIQGFPHLEEKFSTSRARNLDLKTQCFKSIFDDCCFFVHNHGDTNPFEILPHKLRNDLVAYILNFEKYSMLDFQSEFDLLFLLMNESTSHLDIEKMLTFNDFDGIYCWLHYDLSTLRVASEEMEKTLDFNRQVIYSHTKIDCLWRKNLKLILIKISNAAPNLKSLKICPGNICEKMQTLYGSPPRDLLVNLLPMCSLQLLDIRSLYVWRDGDVAMLSDKFPNLTVLKLFLDVTEVGVMQLSKLAKLEELHFEPRHLRPGSSDLASLSLMYSKLVEKMPQLKVVGCTALGAFEQGDEGSKGFWKIRPMAIPTKVSLQQFHTSEHFPKDGISKLSNLRGLLFSELWLPTHPAIGEIASLENLRELCLTDVKAAAFYETISCVGSQLSALCVDFKYSNIFEPIDIWRILHCCPNLENLTIGPTICKARDDFSVESKFRKQVTAYNFQKLKKFSARFENVYHARDLLRFLLQAPFVQELHLADFRASQIGISILDELSEEHLQNLQVIQFSLDSSVDQDLQARRYSFIEQVILKAKSLRKCRSSIDSYRYSEKNPHIIQTIQLMKLVEGHLPS